VARAVTVAFAASLAIDCATPQPEARLLYHLALRKQSIHEVPSRTVTEPGWLDGVYVSPSGTEVPIIRRPQAELSIESEAIREAILYRSAWSEAVLPSSEMVETRLLLGDEARGRLATIASERPGYWLLVTFQGTAMDLIPIGANLPDAISGGVFSSEEEARRFYRSISDRIRIVMPSPAEVDARRTFLDESTQAVLWHLKCDDAFRSEMEAGGVDPSALLLERGDEVDCTDPPPSVPGAPQIQ